MAKSSSAASDGLDRLENKEDRSVIRALVGTFGLTLHQVKIIDFGTDIESLCFLLTKPKSSCLGIIGALIPLRVKIKGFMINASLVACCPAHSAPELKI